MECKDVKTKLKDYLAGSTCDDETNAISKHITDCDECMKAMLDIEASNPSDLGPMASRKDLKKMYLNTRKKLMFRIIITTLCFLIGFYMLISVILPGIGSTILFSGDNFSNHTRAFADIIQFSQPSNVGGYGNSFDKGVNFYTRIKSYTHNSYGTRIEPSTTYEAKLYYFKKGIVNPLDINVDFIHPETIIAESLANEDTVSNAKSILNRNGEATVATVDISLNSIISMNDIQNLLKNYDVKILWMAIESGEEDVKPINLSYGLNQYIQWGIPGKVFSPNELSSKNELNADNVSDYEKIILDEMEWLNENKKLIKPNKNFLKSNKIDNSIGEKAKYVLDNGIKIYGLRITGPSDEILRIHEALDIRYESVEKIDFWYWE